MIFKFAKEHLKGKFIVLNGDDIFHKDDIKRCVGHDLCFMVKEVDNPECFGIAEVDGDKSDRGAGNRG